MSSPDASPKPASVPVSSATERYLEASLALSTVEAYASDWRDFELWCRTTRRRAMPATPASIADYLARLADDGSKVATIDRRVAAIAKAHQTLRANGDQAADPTKDSLVRQTVQGIRRASRDDPDRARPLTLERVQRILTVLPDSLVGQRDRALLLTGFWGALRRSELVGLKVGDLDFDVEGVVVRIGRGKTNQDYPDFVGLPQRDADDCPVEALSDWLEAAGIADGPIFRAVNRAGRVNPKALNPETVSRRLKTLAATAALPEPHEYSGHSLRAGFITSAKAAGVPEDRIMRHTRHRSVLVMRTYDRPEALWAQHPARMLW